MKPEVGVSISLVRYRGNISVRKVNDRNDVLITIGDEADFPIGYRIYLTDEQSRELREALYQAASKPYKPT